MADFTELLATIQSAAQPAQPLPEKGIPFVVVPEGYSVHDLERLLPEPVTTRASVTLTDAGSFNQYVGTFAVEHSLIFSHDDGTYNPRMVAVIDYSGKESPRHGRHRATLQPRVSEAWKRWTAFNGKKVPQAEFARWLEENSLDVRQPEAATLIEVARSIEATKSGAFRSGVRLADGSFQLTYSETVSATTNDGKLSIPEKITLGIPVFERGDLYAVEAWFRYRIEDGKLMLSIDLHRPRYIFDDAWIALVKGVGEILRRSIIFGTP